jgi:hypothetical protein
MLIYVNVNSAFVPAANLDFGVFRGSLKSTFLASGTARLPTGAEAAFVHTKSDYRQNFENGEVIKTFRLCLHPACRTAAGFCFLRLPPRLSVS